MPRLYVATNGLSVWESDDLGARIGRMPSGTNLYSGSQVWALARHPPTDAVFAGTDSGLYRLEAGKWTHVPAPMDEERLVTAIAFRADRPDWMMCGTQPAALYRSEDGGRSWARVETAMKRFTTSGFYGSDKPGFADDAGPPAVRHWTRVTQIVVDPEYGARVWAGVEIDGAWLSEDGGRSFARVGDGLRTDDIHGFCALAGGPLFATTNAGLFVSQDKGRRWTQRPLDAPQQYVRSILERPDGRALFLTNGNGPPGTDGHLFRSRDRGESWEEVRLPGRVESSLYFLAAHPADSNLLFAAATLGQLWRSRDGGENWEALAARLPEIRALLWVPD